MNMQKNKRKKLRIALLFGGKSAEHEISLMSARSIYNALDKGKYDICLIGITKQGQWLPIPKQELLSSEKIDLLNNSKNKSYGARISFTPSQGVSLAEKQQKGFDAVFPILHGPYGEDGSVQGFLKLVDIPFVGADVIGSAVGMDKDVMKRLLRDGGFKIANFVVINKTSPYPSFKSLTKKLGKTIFIKPANLGSSVGVYKVKNQKEYKDALKKALEYDKKIIAEEEIKGREIECSVLGNGKPIASLPGEIITEKSHHEFYSYEAKYTDEKGVKLAIPAKLTSSEINNIQKTAIKVFKVLCCRGMARIDFFLKKNGQLLVNEINTLPGFTEISMFPKLWEISGIPYSKLLDRLIELALESD